MRNTATLSLGLAVALIVTALASPCEAQQSAAESATDETEARALFEAGRVAFSDGRFDEALAHFTRSYELSERPVLTFNIASAHDRLGHVAEAIEWFDRYLALVEDAENRSFVEARLAVLRQIHGDAAALAETSTATEESAATDPPATPPRAASSGDEGASIASAVLFTLAGLSGAGGIGAGAYSLSLQSDLDARCPGGACDEGARGQVDTLSTTALITDVLLGVSLASALGATIALVVHASSGGQGDEAASLTPLLGPGVVGAAGRARF